MQNRVTYEFTVIRFVPKVEREEFINVGILLFSKRKRYLGIKYLVSEERLQAFCESANVDQLQTYLQAWESICKGSPQGGPIGSFEVSDRFRWLAAPKSTILQCGATHPGLCHDPEKELEDLFRRYVK